MSYKIFNRALQTLSVCMIAMCAVNLDAARADVLTIGTISTDPLDEMLTFQPFSDFLGHQLAGDGIDKVKIVIASGIPEAVELLKNNEIDLFVDSSVTALIVNKLSGSRFMLRRWKKARDKYRSVIFVNTDSGISKLEDLTGKIVAFEEPFSTSGYFLPALAMLRSGLELSEVANAQSKPAAGTVGYVMALDNETQMTWLERDRVAAAAMAEKDYKVFSASALKHQTAIHLTLYVPYHVVTHREGLDPRYVDRIKEVLKSAHDSEEGQAVMEEFERTTRFEDIPADLLADLEALGTVFIKFESHPAE